MVASRKRKVTHAIWCSCIILEIWRQELSRIQFQFFESFRFFLPTNQSSVMKILFRSTPQWSSVTKLWDEVETLQPHSSSRPLLLLTPSSKEREHLSAIKLLPCHLNIFHPQTSRFLCHAKAGKIPLWVLSVRHLERELGINKDETTHRWRNRNERFGKM